MLNEMVLVLESNVASSTSTKMQTALGFSLILLGEHGGDQRELPEQQQILFRVFLG